jgi:hypothetical protein
LFGWFVSSTLKKFSEVLFTLTLATDIRKDFGNSERFGITGIQKHTYKIKMIVMYEFIGE